MKSIQTLFILISAIVWLFVVYSFVSHKQDGSEKHIEIAMRDIGHHILLYAKDSTSRVLPVEKLNDNVYQISFENEFRFLPDSLINIVHRQMSKNGMAKDYAVSVLNCQKLQTIFAFEISSKNKDILACKGRQQEHACYLIQIEFLKTKPNQYTLFLIGLLTLGIGFLLWWMGKRQSKTNSIAIVQNNVNDIAKENFVPSNQTNNFEDSTKENLAAEIGLPQYIQIGKLKFYPQKNAVMDHDMSITLSDRETKLLSIFADHINAVVERDRLVKEVWEDEGLFVMSRNLDVFVSKLRKKLVSDPAIKIVNVHGKGYKLVVE